MKAGWWKILIRVKVGNELCDISDLPKEVIARIFNQIGQGAVAGAFDLPDDYKLPKRNQENKKR